uniref:Uncharacterized protein n=1 Tax=Ditylenchus dipsaci TaxID=166011 RepID=A0A915DQ13_9BILA
MQIINLFLNYSNKLFINREVKIKPFILKCYSSRLLFSFCFCLLLGTIKAHEGDACTMDGHCDKGEECYGGWKEENALHMEENDKKVIKEFFKINC